MSCADNNTPLTICIWSWSHRSLSSTLKISFIAYNATSFLTEGFYFSPVIDIVCKLQQRSQITAMILVIKGQGQIYLESVF